MVLNELLPNIMALCGQMGKNGIARNSTVNEYNARIPMLADLGQRELMDGTETVFEYTKADDEGTGRYIKVDMPDDFNGVSYVVDTRSDGNYIKHPFYKFEGTALYIENSYKGTLRIVYNPVPDIITSLDDDLYITDRAAITALVYYICAMLLLDENPQKADFYQQKYEEQRALSMRKVAMFEPIYDVYDTSCRV